MKNSSAIARRCRHLAQRRVFLFSVLALAVSGSQAAELRGFVSEGAAGVLQYQPCTGDRMSQQLYPIEDRTANESMREGVDAVRRIMLHRYRPLYVEFRGERTKTGAIAHQFQRAVGFVESCKTLPRDIAGDVRLLAVGQAPAWRLVVSDTTGTLETPEKTSVKLPAAAFKAPGTEQAKANTARVFETRAENGAAFKVEVNPLMCTDGRSETAYGARVTIVSGTRRLEGCAARF